MNQTKNIKVNKFTWSEKMNNFNLGGKMNNFALGKMNRLSLFILIAGLILLFIAGTVRAEGFNKNGYESDLQISFEHKNLSIESGGEIAEYASFTNTGAKELCFDLFTETSFTGMEAILPEDNLCIAAGQAQKIALSIFAPERIPQGTYTAKIFAEQNGKIITGKQIPVDVEEQKRFDIEPEYDNINFFIESYTEEIEFELKNLDNERKTVYLSSDDEMFVPEFNESIVHLRPLEARNVSLVLHVNSSTPKGIHKVNVYAEEKGERKIQRSVEFGIKSKAEFREKTFELEIMDKETEIKRGQEKKVRFRVSNLSYNAQRINLMVNFTLEHELMQKSALIPANSSEIFYLEVKANEYDKAKTFEGIITAYNANNESEQDTFEVTVLGEHKFTAELLNNGIETGICDTKGNAFELEIKNTGDFKESFDVRIIDYPSDDIQAKISEEDFRLMPDETKKIMVFVAASEDAKLGDYKMKLRVSIAGQKKDFELRFKVTEDETDKTLEYGVIEIIGFPSEIEIDGGKETKLVFFVKNNSDESIEDIKIELRGLYGETGLTASNELISLNANEIQRVEMVLRASKNAENATINATIEAKSTEFIDSKPVQLKVYSTKASASNSSSSNAKGKDEGITQAAIAGMAGLGNMLGGGLLMILIVLVAIILMFSLLRSDKVNTVRSENKRWVVYQKRRGLYYS